MKVLIAIFAAVFLNLAYGDDRISSVEIKQLIMAQSISKYTGECPCPFSIDSKGLRCGKRSEYQRSSKDNLYCYPKKMVEQFRIDNDL